MALLKIKYELIEMQISWCLGDFFCLFFSFNILFSEVRKLQKYPVRYSGKALCVFKSPKYYSDCTSALWVYCETSLICRSRIKQQQQQKDAGRIWCYQYFGWRWDLKQVLTLTSGEFSYCSFFFFFFGCRLMLVI